MVVLLYRPNTKPDEHVVGILEKALRQQGYDLFIDRRSEVNLQRARLMDDWIRQADNVVLVVSAASAESEALDFELDTVADVRRAKGKPRLITVRIGIDQEITGPIGSYVREESTVTWIEPSDDHRAAAQVIAALSGQLEPAEREVLKDPEGTAKPANPYYTLRRSDAEFDDALAAGESVILVRGPRQVGKTSLIGRGVDYASRQDWRHVSTDFQKLNAFQLTDVNKFCRLLARTLARQLRFTYDFDSEWVEDFGPNLNLDHFIRALLGASERRLVWFMDEADRIFSTPFASDFYGLVRTWHNARATDPSGPWDRLSVVIGYATEARLFIRDLNQSPFNVGRQIRVEPFDFSQTTDLNEKLGGPVKRKSDLEGLQFLLGGQPFLTHKALDLLARHTMEFSDLVEKADQDDGPFADHLKRVLYAVSQAPDVLSMMRQSLAMMPMTDSDPLQRLISAGILRESADGVSISCDLYAQYLARRLA